MYEEKDQAIKDVMNMISKQLTGKTVEEHTEQGTCATCGKPVGKFKDALSVKEYMISRMCQECQDEVFG